MAHQNLGYFPHDRVNWRLGLVTSFQAYHRHSRPISLAFAILSCSVVFVIFFGEKNIYSVFIVISIQQILNCHLVMVVWHPAHQKIWMLMWRTKIWKWRARRTQAHKALIKKQKSPTLGRHKLQCSLFATFS